MPGWLTIPDRLVDVFFIMSALAAGTGNGEGCIAEADSSGEYALDRLLTAGVDGKRRGMGSPAASDEWHTTAVEVDLRPGGRFSSRMEVKDGSAGFDFAGTYTDVVEHERLAYVFGDRSAEVLFRAVPGGTAVRVTFDSEATHPVEEQRQGWQAILDNFKRHVEA